MTFAELELEADKKLKRLKKRLGFEAIKMQGKRPSTLKASMCYIITQETGFPIAKTRVAEAYGCTTVALSKNVKLLKQLMQHNRVDLNGQESKKKKETSE